MSTLRTTRVPTSSRPAPGLGPKQVSASVPAVKPATIGDLFSTQCTDPNCIAKHQEMVLCINHETGFLSLERYKSSEEEDDTPSHGGTSREVLHWRIFQGPSNVSAKLRFPVCEVGKPDPYGRYQRTSAVITYKADGEHERALEFPKKD